MVRPIPQLDFGPRFFRAHHWSTLSFAVLAAVLQAAEDALGRGAKPPGVEASAMLPAGSKEPRCWWGPFETITENAWNLAASRYKLRVAEPVPDEDPAELIREVLAIEKEITEGLGKLLKEIEA